MSFAQPGAVARDPRQHRRRVWAPMFVGFLLVCGIGSAAIDQPHNGNSFDPFNPLGAAYDGVAPGWSQVGTVATWRDSADGILTAASTPAPPHR